MQHFHCIFYQWAQVFVSKTNVHLSIPEKLATQENDSISHPQELGVK